MKPPHARQFWEGRDAPSYRCADCGRTREEVEQIDVHHVRGREEGDHPDNLVGVCRRCHLRRRHGRDAKWLRSPYDPPGPTRTSPPAPRSLGPV